ncbi:MAG: carboxymuconolactone decarboxylase family protein [Actinomycetota bacterium]|jgi:hypothetical protein
MRLTRSRLPLTTSAEWDEDTRRLFAGVKLANGQVLNIFRTLAHHPKLLKRWMVFANHVLIGSTLPARERELIILRTGYLCGSGYEWAQHAAIGRDAGLSDSEIERIAEGPTSIEWSDQDRALLLAADELVGSKFISEATYALLSERWNAQQLLDIVFAVGQYTLVSMTLNTFGVQLEDSTDAFPARLFVDGLFPLPSDRT